MCAKPLFYLICYNTVGGKMERTVPKSASDEIDLYIRTIYSLLRSTTEVQIRSLEEVHAGMNSSLHIFARNDVSDTSALIYATLRLPDCIAEVETIILGQSSLLFDRHGYQDVENWERVFSRARRRPTFYNQKGLLAVFIASQSDIEDVVPILTAYQIEWNKIHATLQKHQEKILLLSQQKELPDSKTLADLLNINVEDAARLLTIWGEETINLLKKIVKKKCKFKVRLLNGSLSEYRKATRIWWDTIESVIPSLLERPVYFISSNPHSIPNLLSGFALMSKPDLINFIENSSDQTLRSEWDCLQQSECATSIENFLYYVLKKYQQSSFGINSVERQSQHEGSFGIHRIHPQHSFDVETQVIELQKLDMDHLDPRLVSDTTMKEILRQSDALIFNIDYPLGLGAYNILIKIAEHVSDILGVYIMGKSATLNGVRGDIMIPNVVQDEHSQNTYLFNNCFTASTVTPFLNYGTVLDNQKALTVLGTFLQNSKLMDVMYREGYTDIEMEAGPYLSAIYEMSRPKRHPVNEIVNLQGLSFEVGILHYVSDTPMSKGKNLGAGALSYEGVDSTYASSLSILSRIFELERLRVKR